MYEELQKSLALGHLFTRLVKFLILIRIHIVLVENYYDNAHCWLHIHSFMSHCGKLF